MYQSDFKVKIEEGARDFRMMTRKMTDAVLALSECNRFSKGLFGWVGFKTKWLPYHNVERAAGDTKWSILSCLNIPWMGYWAFPLFLCQRRLTAAFCSAVLRFYDRIPCHQEPVLARSGGRLAGYDVRDLSDRGYTASVPGNYRSISCQGLHGDQAPANLFIKEFQ